MKNFWFWYGDEACRTIGCFTDVASDILSSWAYGHTELVVQIRLQFIQDYVSAIRHKIFQSHHKPHDPTETIQVKTNKLDDSHRCVNRSMQALLPEGISLNRVWQVAPPSDSQIFAHTQAFTKGVMVERSAATYRYSSQNRKDNQCSHRFLRNPIQSRQCKLHLAEGLNNHFLDENFYLCGVQK